MQCAHEQASPVGCATPARRTAQEEPVPGPAPTPDTVPAQARPVALVEQTPGAWRRRPLRWRSACCATCTPRPREDVKGLANDVQQQLDEAARLGCAEQAALCAESTGDQMGLHEQAGTAGPRSTYFCLFCLATLTKQGGTLEAAWPQLPHVPSDWRRSGRGVRSGRRHHPYVRTDPRSAAAQPRPRTAFV